MGKRIFLCAAALIGMTVALGHPAHADIMLRLSDGVATTGTLTDTDNDIQFSGTVGRYDINLTAGVSNVPGTAVNGRLEITNLSVSLNTANDVGTRTLSIDLAAEDYTLPGGSPLSLDSSGSVTFTEVVAGEAMWTFRSWADGTNSGGFRAGVGTPGVGIVAPSSNPGSLSEDDTAVTFTRGSHYSLSSLTTITLLSINATANSTGASVTNAVVPEPTTLAATFTALPLLGGFYLRRRMKKEA